MGGTTAPVVTAGGATGVLVTGLAGEVLHSDISIGVEMGKGCKRTYDTGVVWLDTETRVIGVSFDTGVDAELVTTLLTLEAGVEA